MCGGEGEGLKKDKYFIKSSKHLRTANKTEREGDREERAIYGLCLNAFSVNYVCLVSGLCCVIYSFALGYVILAQKILSFCINGFIYYMRMRQIDGINYYFTLSQSVLSYRAFVISVVDTRLLLFHYYLFFLVN